MVVWFRAPDGCLYAGEASPLPGWSTESLADVLGALETRASFNNFPSLVFAEEMAAASFSHWEGFPPPAGEAPLSALVSSPPADWLREVCKAVAAGAQTVKIKTKPDGLRMLPDFFQAVEGEIPGEIRFRFDGNRTLDYDQFAAIASRLPSERIAFFEEPLRDAARLPELIRVSPIPIALDETLREISPSQLPEYAGAGALIFKPTLMGGWAACQPFAQLGAKLGMEPVISAAFESGLGISMLSELALRLTPHSAAGLDTYSFLEDDLLRERLDFSGYRHRPGKPQTIDEQKLD